MKVTLPSQGILGTKTVEMRAPTFGDLREMNNTNQIDGIVKLQFVKRLVDPHVDWSKVTKMDLDYLFLIAAFSLQFNRVTYKVRCPKCGNIYSKEFRLDDKEITTVSKKGYPYKTKINGMDLEYSVLSVAQEEQALEYALQSEDFESAYEDACAAFILGKSIEQIDEVRKIDASIYFSTFLYQQCMFHGVILEESLNCSCSHKSKVRLNADASLVQVSIQDLMRQFAEVSDHMSFEGFLSFTIPEFSAYIESLNTKVNG